MPPPKSVSVRLAYLSRIRYCLDMTNPHNAAMTVIRSRFADDLAAKVEVLALAWEAERRENGKVTMSAEKHIRAGLVAQGVSFGAAANIGRAYWDRYTEVCSR